MNATADRVQCSRRDVLGAAAGSFGVGIAGCTTSGRDDGATVAVSSFFTFYDFARRVAAGTPVDVENLVPVGMHGHGWKPDPSITRDIVNADALVHVGEDFQPWADRAIQTVHDDGVDTTLIDVREGIDMIDLGAGLDDDEAVSDGKDPHFWLDPVRAQAAVDNVVEGLVDVAPEHETTFRDNGASVRSELDAIDREWADLVDRADRSVAFLAAHNAFGYLGSRYDLTIEPLVTNLAASDDVRPADMTRARETIATHDLQYVGAAVFEPLRPARQLVSESGVEAYYPVTPYAGTTREWTDRGWGYAEIARNVNMPTFEIVLGASRPGETGLGEDWRNFDP